MKHSIDFLERRKAAIVADLLLKVEADDYHGVADCAMDLREIVAKLEVLREQCAGKDAETCRT